jgi:hypothetical protein
VPIGCRPALNKSFTGSLGCSLLDDLARVEVELNFIEIFEHDRFWVVLDVKPILQGAFVKATALVLIV